MIYLGTQTQKKSLITRFLIFDQGLTRKQFNRKNCLGWTITSVPASVCERPNIPKNAVFFDFGG